MKSKKIIYIFFWGKPPDFKKDILFFILTCLNCIYNLSVIKFQVYFKKYLNYFFQG